MSADARTAAALAVLHAAGFRKATVEVAGHDQAIAVVGGVELANLPAVARLAPDIKKLGFRYLTLDITEPSE